MAITKQRKIKKVEIDYEHGHTAIEWKDEIIEGGNVIASFVHRRAYSRREKSDFKRELPPGHKPKIGAVVDDLDANLPPEPEEV